MEKTCIELYRIKCSLEDLIKHDKWFGPTEVLKKALKKVKKEINAKKKRCTAHGRRP